MTILSISPAAFCSQTLLRSTS